MTQVLLCAALAVSLSAVTRGQSASPQVFQAANVRVSKPGTIDGGGFISNGRAEFRGATMLDLITEAYGVDEDLVIGGPGWLATDRFDLTGASAPSSPDDAVRLMLRALLAERFKLETHKEDRELPVYALTVGKRGPKLKEATGSTPADCNGRSANGDATYECHNMTMAGLAERLHAVAGGYVNHPTVDLTGLTGAYDFTLRWTARGQLRRPGAGGDADAGLNLSLFDAVDRQLGLKLDLQKRSGSVIVIDHVNEAPTDNPASLTRALPPAPEEFEVATVRPSPPDSTTRMQRLLPSGQVELRGVSLQELISVAYNVRPDSLIGAPKWLDSDHFDIVAKGPPATPIDALLGMLRVLLADRFKLAVHTDEQPIEVYALALGSRAPKLKEASGSERAECKISVGDGVRTYTCENTTMAQLAEKLPNVAGAYLDHPMVDSTGLKGAYDFALSWAPKGRITAAAGRGGDAGAPAEPTGDLTVFEAVDKQLGLKLGPQKHPMPVVVIDRVERTPTDN